MVIREIRRNPFARASLMRKTITCGRVPCRWCGLRRGRFFYGWSQDDKPHGDVAWLGPFCNIGCYRDYTRL